MYHLDAENRIDFSEITRIGIYMLTYFINI